MDILLVSNSITERVIDLKLVKSLTVHTAVEDSFEYGNRYESRMGRRKE